MSNPRLIKRSLFAAGLLTAVAITVGLAFALAGNNAGMRVLPDAEGSRLEWLVDTTREETLAQVRARPVSDWRTAEGGAPVRTEGGREALWLRATLRNPGAAPLRGVLQDREYYTDRIVAWIAEDAATAKATVASANTSSALAADPGADAAAGGRAVRLGESLFSSERPWWTFTPALFVEVPAHGERVVYLRETDHYYPQSRWVWWPRMEDYFSAQFREALVKSLCLGALIAVWCYNLVLWLRLRFPDMGHYVGYAAGMTVFNFAQNGGLALFGGGVGERWKFVAEVVSLAVSSLFVIRFARLFLETPARLPRVDRVLKILFFAWIAVGLGAFSMPWTRADAWLGAGIFGVVITHTLLMAAAVIVWLRGLKSARFFVAAFGVLYAGGLPAAIAWGSGSDVGVVLLGLLVCSTLEMLLLSFAMADRFTQTQRQLVEQTEQRRCLQEAFAEELAVEVGERTHELEVANADKDRMLAVIGHDLRSPLTGLMHSADVAKGEFADEVSRTGRALLLMIEDLVLWARLRAGSQVIAVLEARAITLPAVALHRSLAEHEGVELVVDAPESLRVETDLVLVQTLVRNLLANALKFARTRVVLRAERVADGVRFSVGNDGPPLSAEVAKRFASDEDEPITATGGLGLRLCREICRELDLRLEAKSGERGGTEFFVVLPAPTNEPEASA